MSLLLYILLYMYYYCCFYCLDYDRQPVGGATFRTRVQKLEHARTKKKKKKNDQDFFRVLESPPMPKTRRFKEHRVRRGKDRKAIEIDSTCGEIER